MQTIRSLLFYLSLALWCIIIGTFALPALATRNQKACSGAGKIWARCILFSLRIICNLDHKVIGIKNMPQAKTIIASKHQSMWEVLFLIAYLPNYCFILKKELIKIPIFGWYLKPAGMICIDRANKLSATKQVLTFATKELQNGMNIVIFPEGTRIMEEIPLKAGLYLINKENPHVKVIPISLNSGLFWNSKKSFCIKPGTITIHIHPPVEFIDDKEIYLSTLQKVINKL